jgi:hypothetical protein
MYKHAQKKSLYGKATYLSCPEGEKKRLGVELVPADSVCKSTSALR